MSIQFTVTCLDSKRLAPRLGDGGFLGAPSLASEIDGTLTSAQVDKDDVLAVYEIIGTSGGRRVEADVRADGVLLELELQIGQGQVPEAVSQALSTHAPGFQPANEQPRIEKSIRPSAIGLPEIWYEFSGQTFDVEIRSDGKAILIEPA